MRLEPEDLWRGTIPWSEGSLVEVEEFGVRGLLPRGEVHVDQVVALFFGSAGEDVVNAVVKDYGGVLDASEVATIVFGADERAGGGPGPG